MFELHNEHGVQPSPANVRFQDLKSIVTSHLLAPSTCWFVVGVESNIQQVMHTQDFSIVLDIVGYELVRFPFLQVMGFEKFHFEY